MTYKVNACALKVDSTFGNGFQEIIYQRCLSFN
ncbi:GxxExxY protein [Pedobacter namyangjuensis]